MALRMEQLRCNEMASIVLHEMTKLLEHMCIIFDYYISVLWGAAGWSNEVTNGVSMDITW